MKIKEISFILNDKEKLHLVAYFLIFFTSYALEMMGLGLIIPLMSQTSQINEFQGLGVLKELILYFNLDTSAKLIMAICILILLKNIFLIFANYYNQYIYVNLITRFSNVLFNYYINLDLLEILKNKNHSINRRVFTETPIFVDTVYKYIDYYKFILLFTIYFTFAIFVNLQTLIIIFPILIILYLINFFFKKRIKFLGTLRLKSDEKLNKVIIEFLPLLREILLFNLKFDLIKNFKRIMREKYQTILKINFITKNNTHIFEIIIIITILGLFTYLSKLDEIVVQDYINFLIFYAVIFVRTMPILAQIISSKQRMSFAKASTSELFLEFAKSKEFKLDNKKNYYSYQFSNSLETVEFKNVNFKYNENIIFKNLNFEINLNDKRIILIYGKNGSGKSTFIDLISGVLRPTSGEILLNKKNYNQSDLLKITSVVPQNINLINGTLEENIHMDIFKNKENNNRKLDYEKIKYSQIEDIIEDLPDGTQQEIQDRGKNLSGGQIQRIGFARALFKNSKIIIFDEPTNNLDEAGKQKFIKNILELSENKKIILVTHDNEFKEINSKIYKIKNFNLEEIKND